MCISIKTFRVEITSVCPFCVVLIHNIDTFVEDTPHSFLLWQQPAVDARYLFEVRTGADEQQPKHQDAIKRVHYERRGENITS